MKTQHDRVATIVSRVHEKVHAEKQKPRNGAALLCAFSPLNYDENAF